MIRIIVRTTNYGEMSPHGGTHLASLKTFDIEAPELEACLRASGYQHRSHVEVIGAEVIAAPQGEAP